METVQNYARIMRPFVKFWNSEHSFFITSHGVTWYFVVVDDDDVVVVFKPGTDLSFWLTFWSDTVAFYWLFCLTFHMKYFKVHIFLSLVKVRCE